MIPRNQVLVGDCHDHLRRLDTGIAQTCVTSPPYWGLRDYDADDAIGLEATLDDHLDAMVRVFREVRRVLRPDGTLWLNYGDAYAKGGGNGTQGSQGWMRGRSVVGARKPKRATSGFKPKELLGLPWRVAFALQDDGWWLRTDIVWHKPNPMPESISDRPTRAHEFIFLLAPSESYYYDAEAVKEPASPNTHPRGKGTNPKAVRWPQIGRKAAGRSLTKGPATAGAMRVRPRQNPSFQAATSGAVVPFRNKRTVWTIPTQPTSEAHFATFPEALVRPCIQAGTSEAGSCPTCGAPRARILERASYGRLDRDRPHERVKGWQKDGKNLWRDGEYQAPVTKGWQATCECAPGGGRFALRRPRSIPRQRNDRVHGPEPGARLRRLRTQPRVRRHGMAAHPPRPGRAPLTGGR